MLVLVHAVYFMAKDTWRSCKRAWCFNCLSWWLEGHVWEAECERLVFLSMTKGKGVERRKNVALRLLISLTSQIFLVFKNSFLCRSAASFKFQSSHLFLSVSFQLTTNRMTNASSSPCQSSPPPHQSLKQQFYFARIREKFWPLLTAAAESIRYVHRARNFALNSIFLSPFFFISFLHSRVNLWNRLTLSVKPACYTVDPDVLRGGGGAF
jgi:hypothetical protein